MVTANTGQQVAETLFYSGTRLPLRIIYREEIDCVAMYLAAQHRTEEIKGDSSNAKSLEARWIYTI